MTVRNTCRLSLIHILDEINVPTTVSGRVTAELEMAESGTCVPKNNESYGQEGFSKQAEAEGYEAVSYTQLDVYKRQDKKCPSELNKV